MWVSARHGRKQHYPCSARFRTPDELNTANNSASDPTTVNKATPQINWTNPADITYGTPLGGTQLNATASFNGNPVAGSFDL